MMNEENNWTYGNSPQMEKPRQKSDGIGFGIASLVLGILTLLLFCTCISWILGILAIIFGILQLVRCNQKGLAIGGMITGTIGLILSVFLYVLLFIGFGSYDTYNEVYDSIYNDIYKEAAPIDDGTI